MSKISNQNIQIEQQIDLLRQRQMEFDAITSNMAEGLIVCDEQLHILSVNHAAVRLLGAGDRDWTAKVWSCSAATRSSTRRPRQR